MPATTDDILTAQKNSVIATNAVQQILSDMLTAYKRNNGTDTSGALAASTLVKSGAGRLVSFSVSVAGGTDGFCYDAASVAGISTAKYLCLIPAAKSAPAQIGMEFHNGLVIVPGTNQVVTVTYS